MFGICSSLLPLQSNREVVELVFVTRNLCSTWLVKNFVKVFINENTITTTNEITTVIRPRIRCGGRTRKLPKYTWSGVKSPTFSNFVAKSPNFSATNSTLLNIQIQTSSMIVNECSPESSAPNVFTELLECEKFSRGDSGDHDNCDIPVTISNRSTSVSLNS